MDYAIKCNKMQFEINNFCEKGLVHNVRNPESSASLPGTSNLA